MGFSLKNTFNKGTKMIMSATRNTKNAIMGKTSKRKPKRKTSKRKPKRKTSKRRP
jgi:hypothetical protein